MTSFGQESLNFNSFTTGSGHNSTRDETFDSVNGITNKPGNEQNVIHQTIVIADNEFILGQS